MAAQSVLIPVQCEYYALEGLSDLMSTLRLVKRRLNPEIGVEGVLLTMYNGRTNLSIQVAEEVKRHFKGQVYATGDSPEHPAGGGPQPRQAGDGLRQVEQGGRGLPGPGRRAAGADRKEVTSP